MSQKQRQRREATAAQHAASSKLLRRLAPWLLVLAGLALAVNGVPIDVLADRLDTTRGALYKTLHDARRKLRRHLEECGHAPLETEEH